MAGDQGVVATLPALEELGPQDVWGHEGLPLDRRVHRIPDAKLLLVIPPSKDRLVLYRVPL